MNRLATALLLVAAVSAGGGCGDDDESTPTPDVETTAPETTVAPYDITAEEFNLLLEDEKAVAIQQYLEDNDCVTGEVVVDKELVFSVVANTTPPDAAPDDPLPGILAEYC